MAPPLAPLINGHRYSFASIETVAQIGATPTQLFLDMDGISYSEDLDVAFVQGTSRAPIGWTSGTYVPGEATLHLGKSTFTQMVLQVGAGWMGINLILNVSYADIGEILTIDTLIARIVGNEDSYDYSPDPLHVTLKLKPIQILRNGIPPLLNRVF